MNIKLRCKCGATAEWDAGTYINPGGRSDDKGRKFLVEVRADDWMDRHAHCAPMTVGGFTVNPIPIGPATCGVTA